MESISSYKGEYLKANSWNLHNKNGYGFFWVEFYDWGKTFEIQRVASIFPSQYFGDSFMKWNKANSMNKVKSYRRKNASWSLVRKEKRLISNKPFGSFGRLQKNKTPMEVNTLSWAANCFGIMHFDQWVLLSFLTWPKVSFNTILQLVVFSSFKIRLLWQLLN